MIQATADGSQAPPPQLHCRRVLPRIASIAIGIGEADATTDKPQKEPMDTLRINNAQLLVSKGSLCRGFVNQTMLQARALAPQGKTAAEDRVQCGSALKRRFTEEEQRPADSGDSSSRRSVWKARSASTVARKGAASNTPYPLH